MFRFIACNLKNSDCNKKYQKLIENSSPKIKSGIAIFPNFSYGETKNGAKYLFPTIG